MFRNHTGHKGHDEREATARVRGQGSEVRGQGSKVMVKQHKKSHNPTLSFVYVTVMSGGAPHDQPATPQLVAPCPRLISTPNMVLFPFMFPKHILIQPFRIVFLPLLVFFFFFPATALAGVCVLRDTHTRHTPHTHTLTRYLF